MPNIFDYLTENDLIGAKNLVESRLLELAYCKVQDFKMKVIAEMFSQEKDILKEAPIDAVTGRKSGKSKDSIQDAVRTVQKFGFMHQGTEHTMYGRKHTFTHPTGQSVELTSGKNLWHWNHTNGKQGKLWDMIANGENLKDLRNHLANHFQNNQNFQVESIKAKYGEELTEAIRNLK